MRAAEHLAVTGRGMTLIEVLVALAIVAITLAAGIKAAGGLTVNAQRMDDLLVAQWCAENQLSALKLGKMYPPVGDSDFACVQLGRQLPGKLVRLGHVDAGLLAVQPLAGAPDRETLVVQQIADAADHQHLMVLVIAPIAAPLHGTQLRELLLPIAQNMGLDATQLRDLTNREVALGRDGRKRGAHGLWIQTEQPTSVLQTRTDRQPSATFWSQKAHKFTRQRPSGSAP